MARTALIVFAICVFTVHAQFFGYDEPFYSESPAYPGYYNDGPYVDNPYGNPYGGAPSGTPYISSPGGTPYISSPYRSPPLYNNPYGGTGWPLGSGASRNVIYGPTTAAPTPTIVLPGQPYTPSPEEALVFEYSPLTASIRFDRERVHREHNTDLYRGSDDTPDSVELLLVRRGQPFEVEVEIKNENGDPIEHEGAFQGLRLIATSTYSGNRLKDAPHIDIPWNPSLNATVPSLTMVAPGRYRVWLPVDAHVGHFSIAVVVGLNENNVEVPTMTSMAVFFNPWNPSDQTYIEGDAEKEEYVLSEDGLSWGGTENWRTPMPWVHDQFSKPVYETSLRFLDYVKNFDDRKDAVQVARLLSALLNANEDNGLVVGKWEPPYYGGRSPEQWGGSLPIFSLYRSTGGMPVRYGQCWVFAGILCTAGRALGIPSRLITNYNSAHEEGRHGNYLNKVDVFFLPNGMPLQVPGKIWNFHQWVENYMRRDPEEMSGWQVVDATPQELSTHSGVYQVGPASVNDIRNRTKSDFDTDFVISEISSVVYNYFPYNYGGTPHPTRPGFYLMSVGTNSTGRLIVTKNVGTYDPVDITSTYKVIVHPEETEETPVSSNSRRAFEPHLVRPSFVEVGSHANFSLTLDCTRCKEAPQEFEVSMLIQLLQNGASTSGVFPQRTVLNETLHLNQSTPTLTVNWSISEEDYAPFLHSLSIISYSLGIIHHSESEKLDESKVYFESNQIPLWIPPPSINTSHYQPRSFVIEAYFKNPLSKPLKMAKLRVLGSAIQPITASLGHSLAPHEERNLSVRVQLRRGREILKNPTLVTVRVESNELTSSDALLLVSTAPH